MYSDKGIQYQAKLMEVKDNLEQLQELGIKTDKFEKKICEIEKTVADEVQNTYDHLDQTDSNIFLEDTLISIYDKNYTLLDRMNTHIVSEYQDYYQIYVKLNQLNMKLKTVNCDNIYSLIEESKDLLNSIRVTSTVDYEVEKDLVEHVYQLIYYMVKLELVYTNQESLLKYLKSDLVDVSYISSLIKLEVSSLDSTEKNKSIFNRFNELKEEGLDDTHILDKQLIIMLISVQNQSLVDDMRQNFLKKVTDYEKQQKEFKRLTNENSKAEEEIDDLKKKMKVIFWKRFGKKLGLLVNFALVGMGLLGSYHFSKRVATGKEYKTVTTVYDSDTDESIVTEEYGKSIQDTISLVEYSPWEEPGYFRDGYERNVYYYQLDNIDVSYSNLQDYLDSSLKDNMTYTKEIQLSQEQPKDMNYHQNKYIITAVRQNENDYILVEDKTEKLILYIVYSFGIIFVDILARHAFSKNSLYQLKKDKKDGKVQIKENSQLLLENKVKLEDIMLSLSDMRRRVLADYETLSSPLQDDQEIKKKMLILEKGTDDETN